MARRRLEAASTRLEGTDGRTNGDGVGLPKERLYPTPILDCDRPAEVVVAAVVVVEVVAANRVGGRPTALLCEN